jgi:hypothetical protein
MSIVAVIAVLSLIEAKLTQSEITVGGDFALVSQGISKLPGEYRD